MLLSRRLLPSRASLSLVTDGRLSCMFRGSRCIGDIRQRPREEPRAMRTRPPSSRVASSFAWAIWRQLGSKRMPLSGKAPSPR
eukprot:6404996-Prymnesium_polylepis.1